MSRRDFAALVLPPATLVPLAADSGGFFPTSWGWAGLALLAVCAVALLLHTRSDLERIEIRMLTALGLLAAVILLSSLWSVDPTRTVLAAERSIVYPIGLAAVLVVVRRSSVGWLLAGVVAATTLVSFVSLATKFVPSVFGAQNDPLASDQLYFPIGYWNGLAGLIAIGIVLAVGLCLETRGWVSAALVACATVEMATLALTQSRGAAGAAVIGGAVCLWLRRRRRPPAAVVAAAVAVLALGGALASLTPPAHADRPGATAPSSGLLSLTGRDALWSVSLQEFSAHPILGSGAGTWDAYWSRLRPVGHNVGNPTSLYMEALGELGIAGLALVVGVLAVPLVVAFRRREAVLWLPAAAGAYTVFCVHAAIDWDWELPAVTLTALWCGAAVLIAARAKPESALQMAPLRRAVGVAGCGLLAVAVTVGLVGNSMLADSAGAFAKGLYPAAASDARSASDWMPWSYDPAAWQGEAELRERHPAAAADSFRSALSKPHAGGVWRLWWDLSRATTGQQRMAALGRMVALNPRSPELRALCLQPDGHLTITEIARFCARRHHHG